MNQYEKLGTLAARGVGLWLVAKTLFVLLTFFAATGGKPSMLGLPLIGSLIGGVAVLALAKRIGQFLGSDLE